MSRHSGESQLPFRSQKLIELCSECKTPATTRCRRCGRPLCAPHAPARRRRCQPCEAFYTDNLPTLSGAKAAAINAGKNLVLLPGAVLVLLAAISCAAFGVGMFGSWGVLGFFPGFAATHYPLKRLNDTITPERALARATKRARRKFLRERKPAARELTE